MSRTGEVPYARPSDGFTLLELLVVLVLIALLFTIIPAASFHPIEAMRLRASATTLASDLRLARNAALTHHRAVSLDFNLPHNSYRIPVERLRRQIPQSVRVVVTTTLLGSQRVSPNIAKIQFMPDGTSTGAKIELREGSSRYLVNLNWLSGRVWLSDRG